MDFKKKSVLLLFAFVFLLCAPFIQAQPLDVKDSAELKIALKKLSVLGSVLYITAHPDDENTALLAYFSKEKLLRTGCLSLTRGGGGQNLIGGEKGKILSLLRTHELLAARKIDGAEQFFTGAVDFGYSKSSEETLSTWGKKDTLFDMVWVIRKFRPQVLITRFPTGRAGHGHHSASTILAVEAFHAAADPVRFPEQLKYLSVWQPKRIVWNSWRPQLENRDSKQPPLLSINFGKYNPLLGKSYGEIAAISRSNHKTQGFGSLGRRGSRLDYFEFLAGTPASKDLFEDVDLTWRQIPGAEKLSQVLQEANNSFTAENPAAILPLLLAALQHMDRLPDSYWVKQKRKELLHVIRCCAGLWIEAAAGKYAVSPGGDIDLTVTLINRSSYPFTLEKIKIGDKNIKIAAGTKLQDNVPHSETFSFRVDADTPYSHPYWLRREGRPGFYTVPHARFTGEALSPTPPSVQVTLKAENRELVFNAPVFYRWRDPAAGEKIRSLEIAPRVTVNFLEKVFYFAGSSPKKIPLSFQSGPAPVSGKITFHTAAGWQVEPRFLTFNIEKEFAGQQAVIVITPPRRDSSCRLSVEVSDGRKEKGRSRVTIDYPHVPPQNLYPAAEARLVRVDLKKRGSRVAYIMGSGDEIPQYLTQVGYEVNILSDEDLQQEDLTAYDAVILGIRAYNTRPILKYQQQLLLDYVSAGGNLLVQYNVSRGLHVEQFGPYPLQLSRGARVTDELAAVTLLEPAHPLFNSPNKIEAADFDNWVQERGLYFAGTWDSRYKALLSCFDKGEEACRGGLLVTSYGKGNFIYSGYSWFRQLPAGVPGALKLFVNMISLEKR